MKMLFCISIKKIPIKNNTIQIIIWAKNLYEFQNVLVSDLYYLDY